MVEPRSVEQTAIAVAHAAWLAAEHAVAAADDMAARLSEAEDFRHLSLKVLSYLLLLELYPQINPQICLSFSAERKRERQKISL